MNNQNYSKEKKESLKHKVIRKGSKIWKLGFFVMRKGVVFYEDLVLYAFNFCAKKSEVYALIDELIKRDVIEVEYRKHKRGQERYVRITEKGFVEICNADNKKEEHLPPHIVKQLLKINSYAAKSKGKKREARLIELNHIKTFFNCANVQTESFNKPSLEQIYQIRKLPPNSNLTDQEQDIQDKLAKGIFYTHTEVKNFNNTYLKSNEAEQFSSVFKGIFINTYQMIVVYAQSKSKSKLIYLETATSEKTLVNFLKSTFMYKHVSALALGNQASFILATAEGRKYGKHNDTISSKYILKALYPDNKLVMSNFSNLYALDINQSCREYLVNILNYKKVQDTMIQELSNRSAQGWTCIGNEIYYTGSDGIKTPAVLMPYYELMSLRKIRDSKVTPVIICSKDQAKTIQHIVHKEPLFIDYKSYEPIKETLPIYNAQGNIKGSQLLQEYLKSKNLSADKKELSLLPDKFNMSSTELYNAIATETISLEDVLAKLNTTPKDNNKQDKKPKGKPVTIEQELYDQLKQYAEQNKRTLRWAAKHLAFKTPDGE